MGYSFRNLPLEGRRARLSYLWESVYGCEDHQNLLTDVSFRPGRTQRHNQLQRITLYPGLKNIEYQQLHLGGEECQRDAVWISLKLM